MSPADQYRSASSVAAIYAVFEVAVCIALAFEAFAILGVEQTFESIEYSDIAISANQLRSHAAQLRFMGWTVLVPGLVSGIHFFFVWLFRANRLARSLGAEGMAFSPGWSVAWFFVPIANLLMPYRVLTELWKASTSEPEDWRQAAASPTVPVWWITSTIASCMHYPARTIAEKLNWIADWSESGYEIARFSTQSASDLCWGLLAANLITIASSTLSLVLVIGITGRLERRRVLIDAQIDSE